MINLWRAFLSVPGFESLLQKNKTVLAQPVVMKVLLPLFTVWHGDIQRLKMKTLRNLLTQLSLKN